MQNESGFQIFKGNDNHFIWGNIHYPFLKKTELAGTKICLMIKAMNLQTDTLLVHEWINMPYSEKFWGMHHTSVEEIKAYYSDLIHSAITYPFLVYCNEVPVAFFEVYDIAKDVVSEFIADPKDDKGVHLLMAPPTYLLTRLPVKIKKLSLEALRFIIAFCFSFSGIENIYAEPDIRNIAANRLAEQCGFRFIKQIQLPDKAANLYVFPKVT